MRPVVVLLAHNVHDRGGMERSLAELVRRASGEVEFHVVAAEIAEDLRGTVRWTRVPVPQRPVPLFFSAFYAAAAGIVPRLRADLVHTMGAIHPGPADLVSVQFCHRAFGRLPAEARAVPGGPARRLNRRVDVALSSAAERRSYAPERVRHFAAASDGIARELGRHYPGVPATVVPNGFSAERFDPAAGPDRAGLRERLGHAPDDVVAVFLGGDWHRKGLRHAIAGVADAVAAGASRLRLAVVGAGDPRPHLEHARALGIDGRVRFFGHSAEPHHHLLAADVFVLPTAYEAFPLVAIEAAAAGLPIVATAVNGVEDLVVDGENGILVPPDGAAVGAALARLVADDRLRAGMGRAARASAGAYTWDAAASATVALYDELLAGRGVRR